MAHKIDKPKQITLNQHVISGSILRRFMERKSGKIQIFDKPSGSIKSIGINSPPFTTNRSWDQRSESGAFFAEVERNFGIIATKILQRNAKNLDSNSNRVITNMFAIWRNRHSIAINPIKDTFLGIPDREIPKDAMDQGEHHGLITTLPNGFLPGRMLAGPIMQLRIGDLAHDLSGVKWGVIRATVGEFILPDTYGEYLIMPLSPKYCLIANEEDADAPAEAVAELNSAAINNSLLYFAARAFELCPVRDNNFK
ncbi:hypothetical protein CLV01_3472 [Delftia sp. 60]|uniref:hypothetical protein n=1 Tax=Delftia sp. 60 TaxID=2035216 RepID=UPI000C6B4D4A|nr:hypothetical protein [Delftia sp. 60]PIF37753.1 hypothetical protein CLU98_2977 [Burkholderiales bacterium 23]PIF67066.1 hypothetical protein CLV01_3472 [Delftia sp. 60]